MNCSKIQGSDASQTHRCIPICGPVRDLQPLRAQDTGLWGSLGGVACVHGLECLFRFILLVTDSFGFKILFIIFQIYEEGIYVGNIFIDFLSKS